MAAKAASFRIEETSIAALHAAYLDGRATALSVCQAHLDRIAAYDRKGPALGAIIINNLEALADAAAMDDALASTERWSAILTIVVQTPTDADRLKKNPLGLYINALNWSKELG